MAAKAADGALGLELDLPAMKRDLRSIRALCRQRYLRHCSRWCGEMLMALQDVDEGPAQVRARPALLTSEDGLYTVKMQ